MNVTAIIDGTPGSQQIGQVVERYVYDPYGRPTFYNGSWNLVNGGLASAYGNEILFCGYRYDPETGMYHVRHRVYHASLGRWSARDPEGFVDGLNLFGYVGSRPVAASDPAGLASSRPSTQPGVSKFGWRQVNPTKWDGNRRAKWAHLGTQFGPTGVTV